MSIAQMHLDRCVEILTAAVNHWPSNAKGSSGMEDFKRILNKHIAEGFFAQPLYFEDREFGRVTELRPTATGANLIFTDNADSRYCATFRIHQANVVLEKLASECAICFGEGLVMTCQICPLCAGEGWGIHG